MSDDLNQEKKIEASNFTMMPNVVFDYWMPRLKPSEFMILMCLCRKIFGWHKTSKAISAKFIAKLTGLSKPTVINSVAVLEKRGLIIKIRSHDERGDMPNAYRLNVTIPVDEIYTEEGVKFLPGGGKESLPGGVKKFDSYKRKSINKEKDTLREYPKKGGKPPASAPPSRSIFFERAKHVKTTEEEHAKLVAQFGLEKTERCYQRLSEWKEDTSRSKWKKSDYRSILRWVAEAIDEEDRKASKASTDNSRAENKEIAKKAEVATRDQAKRRSVEVAVTTDRVRVYSTHPTANMPATELKYSEHGFKEQLENMLRKWNLIR